MNKSSRYLLIALAAALCVPNVAFSQEPIVIKMATLAPLKSPWGQVFARAKKEIEKASNGQVKIKLYAGGSRGDERVMVRKMLSNQLQGAAITSVGLAQINPDVLVLQAPGLIRSNKQLDCVRKALAPEFEAKFAEKGFKLLGWGDVGKTYLMGSVEVKNPSDLSDAKPWVWETDPGFRAVYKAAGATSTPLAVPDVLQGLTNGVIKTIYASPVAATSLQWHPYVKFINAKLITIGIGATLVKLETWNQATAEQKELIRSINDKWHGKLTKKVRAMNSKALAVLKDRGAVIVAGDSAKWNAVLTQARNDMAGKIYSQALLDRATALAAKCK